MIKEIVPEIRAGKFRDVIELLLSLLSMMFGYGTRRYTFERGQITTATEYIGQRQDQMQELNRQRQPLLELFPQRFSDGGAGRVRLRLDDHPAD